MKELKKHLRQAREEYESQHYPGDLSADVLGPRSAGRRWLRTVATIAAAAAAALLVILWPNTSTPPTDFADHTAAPTTAQSIADATGEATVEIEDISLADVPSLSMPELPSEMYFSASWPDLSISMPTITLVGLDEQPHEEQSTSTTRESV